MLFLGLSTLALVAGLRRLLGGVVDPLLEGSKRAWDQNEEWFVISSTSFILRHYVMFNITYGLHMLA